MAHILLAEDDEDIRAVAVLALRRAGFEVTAVGDGASVLARVHEVAPTAVLLDWMMPILDGPATCQALRDDPRTAMLPIIFFSAKGSEADVERMLNLGVRGHIAKPFNPLELGAQLRALLDSAAAP